MSAAYLSAHVFVLAYRGAHAFSPHRRHLTPLPSTTGMIPWDGFPDIATGSKSCDLSPSLFLMALSATVFVFLGDLLLLLMKDPMAAPY